MGKKRSRKESRNFFIMQAFSTRKTRFNSLQFRCILGYANTLFIRHLLSPSLDGRRKRFLPGRIPWGQRYGKDRIIENNASRAVSANARIEVIGRGYSWSEGPVWVPRGNIYCFSTCRRISFINGGKKSIEKIFVAIGLYG